MRFDDTNPAKEKVDFEKVNTFSFLKFKITKLYPKTSLILPYTAKPLKSEPPANPNKV